MGKLSCRVIFVYFSERYGDCDYCHQLGCDFWLSWYYFISEWSWLQGYIWWDFGDSYLVWEFEEIIVVIINVSRVKFNTISMLLRVSLISEAFLGILLWLMSMLKI